MKIQEELKNERRNSVSLAENFDEDRLTSETGGSTWVNFLNLLSFSLLCATEYLSKMKIERFVPNGIRQRHCWKSCFFNSCLD